MANKGVGLDLLNAGHCNGYAVRPSFLAGGFSGSVPHVMELKHIVALAIFICAGFGSVLMNLLSQRVRDISLFCMVFMAVLGGLMDVNFFGQLWYRGTSRGVEIMPIDIAAFGLLVGSVVLPRYAGPRIYWPASFGILLLYFAYCGGSVLTTTPQHYGSWELWKIFRGVIIFLAAAMFIRTRRELQILVLALGCAVCFEGLWCVQQKVLRGVGRVPGTLFHENSLSMYLCTVSPVLLAAALSDWPRWMRSFCAISCAVAAVTVVMTLSRAGIPAFGLTMFGTAFFCVTWRITRRKIVAGLGFTIGATLLLAVAWEPLTQRFGAVSLKEELMEADAVETRGTYWRIGFAIADEQPYGVGLNNWSYAVSKKYGPKLGYLYNDYDEITWDALPADGTLRKLFGTRRLRELGWHRARSLP